MLLDCWSFKRSRKILTSSYDTFSTGRFTDPPYRLGTGLSPSVLPVITFSYWAWVTSYFPRKKPLVKVTLCSVSWEILPASVVGLPIVKVPGSTQIISRFTLPFRSTTWLGREGWYGGWIELVPAELILCSKEAPSTKLAFTVITEPKSFSVRV